MYRFLLRPKWIGFHLLVIAAIVAMINLGFWQLRRLDQRREFNSIVEARYDADPVPLDELLPADAQVGDDSLDDIEWRPVTAAGTYLDGESILIVNRSQRGRAGDDVVTPLRLDDGRLLLVNRGLVPLGVDVPPAPTGAVRLAGRVHPSQERGRAQLRDPSSGALTEAQRVDIARLAPQLSGEAVPVYLDLIGSDPAEVEPFPEPVVAPELTEGNHLSYAVQWFLFSCAAAVGWVLAVRHSVRERRRPGTGDGDDTGQPDDTGSPDEPSTPDAATSPSIAPSRSSPSP